MKDDNLKKILITGTILLVAIVVITVFASSSNEEANNPPEQQNVSDDSGKITNLDNSSVPDKAMYTITYDVPWSNQTHPNSIPTGAHVSPIVIVSHKETGDLFSPQTLASNGIEIMAETGGTSTLIEEMEQKTSVFKTTTGRVFNTPDSNILKIEVSQDYPLLSAVSMLAPSPDWFVAVNDIEFLIDNQWIEEIELTMTPYDAGTDSGATFTAKDDDTNPAQLISSPSDKVFIDATNENDFATITITKE